MIDLGRPEAVAIDLDSLLGPGGVDLVGAQALVLCGAIDPETAWTVAVSVAANPSRKLHEQVSMQSVVAMLAVVTGHLDAAAQFVADAASACQFVGRQVAAMVSVAEAAVALCVDGEEAAAALLRDALDLAPLGRFPGRSQLYALAACASCCPSTPRCSTASTSGRRWPWA